MTKKVLLLCGDFTEDYSNNGALSGFIDAGLPSTMPFAQTKKPVIQLQQLDMISWGEQTYTELRGHNSALTASFEDVKTEDYEGLFITGGRAPEYIRLNPRVIDDRRKKFFAANKPVAAICHGPQVLTAAGVLEGYTATAYPAVGADISLAGGIYKEVDVSEAVVDRNLVTSPAWPGNTAICREFAKLMGAKIEI